VLAQEHVLPSLVAARAAATPDRVLLQDTDGRSLTYGELQDRIMRWAAAFAAAGVGAGDTVVTMLPNRMEAFEIWLGLAWLRAIEVPLNTAYRGPMLEHTVNNAGARVGVVASTYLPQFDEVRDALHALERIVVPDGDDAAFIDDVAPASGLEPPRYCDIACMIYTSGTTGPSKGVLMPWAELFQFVTTLPIDTLGPGGANYLCLPVFHVSGKSGIYIAVHFDGRLVVRDTFSLTEFWSDIHKYDITMTGLVGVMASFLMTLPEQPGDADNPLRNVVMGPLVPDVEKFKSRFGVRVATGYGMTEIGTPFASDGWNLANATSCGRLRTGYPGYEVRVVDEFDEPLGPGEVGELIVRTAEPWTLNAGYFNRPEATAAAWRNGWFHTGDGFRYDDDGNYYFVDRIKDAIRRRGENISSFEVEGYVTRHPAVQECAALAVPAEHGEDEVKVVVVLQADAADTFDPAELIEFLTPTMPKFMLPRYVQVVDALPKTPTLRVRKVELRADDAATTWDREA
jgi:crotonobetaine/carnitine-CoA ligase